MLLQLESDMIDSQDIGRLDTLHELRCIYTNSTLYLTTPIHIYQQLATVSTIQLNIASTLAESTILTTCKNSSKQDHCKKDCLPMKGAYLPTGPGPPTKLR